jgi:hypothetical protein
MLRKLSGDMEIWFSNSVGCVEVRETNLANHEPTTTNSAIVVMKEVEKLPTFTIRKFPPITRLFLTLEEVTSLLVNVRTNTFEWWLNAYRTSPV